MTTHTWLKPDFPEIAYITVSGVTRVGVTRGGITLFFPEKLTTFSHRPLQSDDFSAVVS